MDDCPGGWSKSFSISGSCGCALEGLYGPDEVQEFLAHALYGDERCPNLRIERPSFSARYVHEGMTLALKGTLFFEMGGAPSSSSWEGWFRYAGLSLSVDRELAEEEDAFLPRVASSLEQAGMPDSSRQAAR